MTVFSGFMLSKLGPEKFGGAGDILRSFDDPLQAAQTPIECSGKIVKIPGMPDMYDWEDLPQHYPPFSTGYMPPEVNFAKFAMFSPPFR